MSGKVGRKSHEALVRDAVDLMPNEFTLSMVSSITSKYGDGITRIHTARMMKRLGLARHMGKVRIPNMFGYDQYDHIYQKVA